MFFIHTGLGEEGTESRVGFGVFAFFSQVTVGLRDQDLSETALPGTKRGRRYAACRSDTKKGFPHTWMPCSRQ